MKLIIGLGNPGKEYEGTRHNIGFKVIDEFLKSINVSDHREKFGGIFYEFSNNGEKVVLLKPQEYINLSGTVIKEYVDYYNLDISDILVISDDLDLDVGNYKLKPSGSSGGHNGLKNIESCLGTMEYKRLRIGISNNKDIDTRNYVMSKFNETDLDTINGVVKIAVGIIEDYLKMPFSDLMTKYNKKQ